MQFVLDASRIYIYMGDRRRYIRRQRYVINYFIPSSAAARVWAHFLHLFYVRRVYKLYRTSMDMKHIVIA